jgi:very-short-patch-repair endonuclease
VGWEPSAQEIEDKLFELAYVWGDIEEQLAHWSLLNHDDIESGLYDQHAQIELLALVQDAFRVEAAFERNGFGDPCSTYALLFDVADSEARDTARKLDEPTFFRIELQNLIKELARPWHTRDNLMIKIVSRSTPVTGQICRRLGERHPPNVEPALDDLPAERPPQVQAGFERRDVYWLTPIEARFYDAARESDLFFAVQPWIQGTDRRYRPDFMFFYDGQPHVVELDGHEWHKTKEQRGSDAERERWFEQRGIRVHRFTGSQVHADPIGCVTELVSLLRGRASRP